MDGSMMRQGLRPQGLKRLWLATGHSLRGLRLSYSSEAAFRQEVAACRNMASIATGAMPRSRQLPAVNQTHWQNWHPALFDNDISKCFHVRVAQTQILVSRPKQREHIGGPECLPLRVIKPVYQVNPCTTRR